MAEVLPIPGPPGLPLVGNLGEFSESPLQDLIRLGKTHGEIFRLYFGSRPAIFACSNALVNELCDEKRFHKTLGSALRMVREGVHDGLFTAFDGEANWDIAHRILAPAFGPMSIRGMFDEMYEIVSQLALKLARCGPLAPNAVADDFTRMALDTLALCAMDFRFNSYYHERMHPFVQAMSDFLTECGRRSKRPPFAPSFLYRAANEKFAVDIATMRKTADEVVSARKEKPTDRKDLLNVMLNGVDPKTGARLTDQNITDQLITFLIAGHETTSGMLSFAFYYLLKHPDAYQNVQREVDRVVGRDRLTVDHISKLPYTAAVLRETLRVSSAIPVFSVTPREDTLLAGKYLVRKGEPVTALLSRAHLDPVVFGDDATEFKPERMLDENFSRLNDEFPNCWKPFGNGKRGCIGRPFAWQEALIAMAVLFQNFDFSFDDATYELQIQETLTIKPKGLYMRASLRHGMTPTHLFHAIAGKAEAEAPEQHPEAAPPASPDAAAASAAHKPLTVLYGSNSGTCEAMAQRVAVDAPRHGFRATTVAPLDDATQRIPRDRPVVIVTASYDGQPPSNAASFVAWIEGVAARDDMDQVSYAVFGCGHHDWTHTYHRIPKLVDARLAELGARRVVPLATTDAAERDMFSDFEAWEDASLWPALRERYGTTEDSGAAAAAGARPADDGGLSVAVSLPRKATLRQNVDEALVVSVETLAECGSVKKHMEIELPPGVTYRAGDYLAVLPMNPKRTVSRVFRRFGLSWDATLSIAVTRPTTLPAGVAISAADVLGSYVELSHPATRRNIQALAATAQDKDVAEELKRLAGDDYHARITSKRVSVLDLLERYPSLPLPFGAYLGMLPPMRMRQYSISSSPLADASRATLTYSVLDQQAYSGHGPHVGVATNFLAGLAAGERVQVAVRPTKSFLLPEEADKTPLVCVAAGSGMAPFRGFVQERAMMLAAGRQLAPALLFFGCRHPDGDDLYTVEMARWEAAGAVDVRRAYSRAPERSAGCKYVQHRLSRDRADVQELWARGARVYVCGSGEVSRAVEAVFVDMVREGAQAGAGLDEAEARAWFEEQRNGRYVTDVFD